MKPYRLKDGKSHKWRKIGLSLFIILLIVLTAGYFGVKTLYEHNLQPVNSAATDDIVYTLASGATLTQVAEELKDVQLIRSTRAFVQYVRSNGLTESLQAGTYRLKQSMSVAEITDILVGGKTAADLFTILPGYQLSQIKDSFKSAGFTDSEVSAGLDPSQYRSHPALVGKPASASLDGYLYPDSYHYIEGQTTVAEIVKQALDEMDEALSADVRAGITAQGLSVFEGVTLASIVEREVSALSAQDRPRVAQVFLKRLSVNMALQSNATDGYPANYDTYNIQGLPPGPISNVTESSLQAVANPADTDFLYFVSGKDCVTRFSGSLGEHEVLIGQHGVARPEDNCT